MRLYTDIPIWMRVTDWENKYGPAEYSEKDINRLRELRQQGLSYAEMGKVLGIHRDTVQKQYVKYWGRNGKARINQYG
jgi:intein-encoded DNA endonuclease-like protein